MKKQQNSSFFKSFLTTLLAGTSLSAVWGLGSITPDLSAQVSPIPLVQTIAQGDIQVQNLQGFEGVIRALTLTPDGTILIIGTGDNKVSAIDLGQQKVLYSRSGKVNDFTSIAVTSDGKIFATADDQAVGIFRVSNGQRIRTLRGHTDKVSDVAISPDGKMLVSVSGGDQTIRVWDLPSGRLLKTLAEDVGATTEVVYTPDGEMFMTGAVGNDRTIKFWDAQTFELLKTSSQQPGFVNDLAVTEDGQKLVAAVRNFVKNWQLSTGEELGSIKGPSLEINAIAIAPDNRTVATANKEGTIMLFDIVSGQKITTLEGHKGWVLSVAFSPDGQYLYSGAEDKIIKIWQLKP